MSVRDLRGGANAQGDSPEGPKERVNTGFADKPSTRQAPDVVTSVPASHDVSVGKMSDTRARAELPPGYGSVVDTPAAGDRPEDKQADHEPAMPKR